jgi:hypothetical protein
VQSHCGYRLRLPVLVLQGAQYRVLPYEATGKRLSSLLKNARSFVIAGGPHAIIWTHADEVCQALLDFIGHPCLGKQTADRTRERAARLTVATTVWTALLSPPSGHLCCRASGMGSRGGSCRKE